MANLRIGSHGEYYGSTYNNSDALTLEQMQINAKYITLFFIKKGWTLNAISGMLGNMQIESSLNPGRWQSDDVGNTSGGYGLVQWTPATNYINWCENNNLSDPSEMDNNLNRIIYELENNLQWILTSEYDMTFSNYTKSTNDPDYLASAFLKNYERAGVEVEDIRRNNAIAWYSYLSGFEFEGGENGDTPGSTNRQRKKKYNFVIFGKKQRYI